MTDDLLLVETGNTTIKVAAGGDLSISRYDDPRPVIALCRNSARSVVVAPIGRVLASQLLEGLADLSPRVITHHDVQRFIAPHYDTSDTLGLDRVLNLLGLGFDAVSVSCGTAITVDAIVGGMPRFGAIMPGFHTAADLLHQRIPVLPQASFEIPPKLPARTSLESVTNGVILGTARAAAAIAAELAPDLPVVLTGGDAHLMQSLWNGDATVDDALLFRGMLAVVKR